MMSGLPRYCRTQECQIARRRFDLVGQDAWRAAEAGLDKVAEARLWRCACAVAARVSWNGVFHSSHASECGYGGQPTRCLPKPAHILVDRSETMTYNGPDSITVLLEASRNAGARNSLALLQPSDGQLTFYTNCRNRAKD